MIDNELDSLDERAAELQSLLERLRKAIEEMRAYLATPHARRAEQYLTLLLIVDLAGKAGIYDPKR